MSFRCFLFLIVSFLFIAGAPPIGAQAPEKKEPPQKELPKDSKKEPQKDLPKEAKKDLPKEAKKEPPKEPFSEVDGSVMIDGKKIEYKATTGRLPVKDLTGKANANIFFMAYTRKTDGKPDSRPLTFCFNGGPGSASLWVHLGLFGPRRVLIDEEGKSLPLPAKLIDNEWSVLDLTDLVFIDPVSTGFSRSDDPNDAKLFHGLEEDTQSVGEFNVESRRLLHVC